jgi:hypothetical protein
MQCSSFGEIRRHRGLLVSSKRAECGNFIGDRAFMHHLVLAAKLAHVTRTLNLNARRPMLRADPISPFLPAPNVVA